jgi:hypothetical protein
MTCKTKAIMAVANEEAGERELGEERQVAG